MTAWKECCSGLTRYVKMITPSWPTAHSSHHQLKFQTARARTKLWILTCCRQGWMQTMERPALRGMQSFVRMPIQALITTCGAACLGAGSRKHAKPLEPPRFGQAISIALITATWMNMPFQAANTTKNYVNALVPLPYWQVHTLTCPPITAARARVGMQLDAKQGGKQTNSPLGTRPLPMTGAVQLGATSQAIAPSQDNLGSAN